MWLCECKDVTSDSEFQQPTPPRPSGHEFMNMAATRAVVWGGDGTPCTIEGVKSGGVDAVYG